MRAAIASPHGFCALGLWAVLGAAGAHPSQDEDWPTRVGRVAEVQGTLWAYDVDERGWVSAWRNRPVAEGDLFAVSDGGRAELRIGTMVLRLDGGSEIAVRTLDDARMVFELHRGALAWRVGSEAHARQSEVRLREGSVRPLGPGHFRIDRAAADGGPAHAAAWRGRLEVTGGGNLIHLDPGERVTMRGDAARGVVTTRPARMPDDRLADWARSADAREASVEAYRHVPPDVTGAEELDRHGQWNRHPDFGAVWVPYDVPAGWEPFRDGRWVWLRPWGWTWADAAPWGFAPFHYGRWVRWGVRWVWWPGQHHVAPVFQPAVVAWVGGPQVSFSVTIGNGVRPPPPVAWVPLAPYQPYVPRYRPPPRHAVPPPHGVEAPPRHHVRPPRYVEPLPPPRHRRDASGPPGWRDDDDNDDRAAQRAALPGHRDDGPRRHVDVQAVEPALPAVPSLVAPSRPPRPAAPEPLEAPGRDGPRHGASEPRGDEAARGPMPPAPPRGSPQLPPRPSLPREVERPEAAGSRSGPDQPAFVVRAAPAAAAGVEAPADDPRTTRGRVVRTGPPPATGSASVATTGLAGPGPRFEPGDRRVDDGGARDLRSRGLGDEPRAATVQRRGGDREDAARPGREDERRTPPGRGVDAER